MLRATQLSGFGGSGRVSSAPFVNSASSTGASITIPADAREGDIAILFDLAQNSSGFPTLVTPAGCQALKRAIPGLTIVSQQESLLSSRQP